MNHVRQDQRVADPREMTDVYEDTIVVVWDPASPAVARDPSIVARELGMHGAVLTAWNPGEARLSHAENEAANQRMLPILEATGCPVWLADGRSTDGSFHEPGFCVWGIGIEHALDIARLFNQYAIYLFRPDGVRQIVWTAG
jgi:hypothetical protein